MSCSCMHLFIQHLHVQLDLQAISGLQVQLLFGHGPPSEMILCQGPPYNICVVTIKCFKNTQHVFFGNSSSTSLYVSYFPLETLAQHATFTWFTVILLCNAGRCNIYISQIHRIVSTNPVYSRYITEATLHNWYLCVLNKTIAVVTPTVHHGQHPVGPAPHRGQCFIWKLSLQMQSLTFTHAHATYKVHCGLWNYLC